MAPRTVELHPRAIAEARAAADRYATVAGEATAFRFEAELERAIGLIADAPQRWPEYRRGTRRYLFRRFPFSVIYRVGSESIQVIAVAHARRRPDYWRRR